MEERYIEIRFIIFINKLMDKFNYSIHILDVIEAYCNLGNIDVNIIKSLVRQIKSRTGPINTYKEEVVYLSRKLGVSYRTLYKHTGITIATQLKIKKYLENYGQLYEGIQSKLTKEEYNAVYKFMTIVDIIKEF